MLLILLTPLNWHLHLKISPRTSRSTINIHRGDIQWWWSFGLVRQWLINNNYHVLGSGCQSQIEKGFWINAAISPNFLVWKICGRHRFGLVSGNLPETMRTLCLSTKFPHQEIRWDYDMLCCDGFISGAIQWWMEPLWYHSMMMSSRFSETMVCY